MARSLLDGTRGLVARVWWRRQRARAAVILAWAAPILFLSLLGVRGQLWTPVDAVIAWGLLLAVALGAACLSEARRDRLDARLVQAIERGTGAQGLLLTALADPDKDFGNHESSPFLALARARSDHFQPSGWPPVEVLSPRRREAESLLLVLFSLTLALAVLPRLLEQTFGPEAPQKVPGQARSEASPGEVQTKVQSLAAALAMEVKTDRERYGPGEDIRLQSLVSARTLNQEALVLQATLLIADGRWLEDAGFGIGLRPLPIPDLEFSIALEGNPEWRLDRSIGALLADRELTIPGVYSIELVLEAKEPRPTWATGRLHSAPWAYRIEDARAQVAAPTPVRAPAQSVTESVPEESVGSEPKPEEQPEPNPGDTPPDQTPPNLGEAEDLGEFRVRPEGVDAEAKDGPEVQKEVKVFDRESVPGGVARPKPREVRFDPSTLKKKAETIIERKDLTPRDRQLLEAYFRKLSGGK